MTPQELKNSILQLAIQGKLVEQRPEEGTAEELYQQIQTEKQTLIKTGKIKKEKPLPEIAEDEKPFDIPESWKWVRLRDICTKIVDGDHNPPAGITTKTEYLMLSATNINHDILCELDKVRYLTKEVFDIEHERTHATVGDIFFTTVGTLGRSCVFDGKYNVCFQRSVSVLTTLVYNLFLKYCLDSSYIQNYMVVNATGTAQKGFYLNQVEKLLIPLPPLAEQKRIVAKIEELLPLIDRYEEAWTKLEEFNKRFPGDMQKSLLQMAIQGKLVEQRPEEGTGEELYQQIQEEKERLIRQGKIKKEKPLPEIVEEEKPFDIPEWWKWVRLINLCKSIADGDHQAPPQVTSGVPFIVISNLSSGRLDFANTRHVPQEYFQSLSKERIAENGDVLFTVTGSYGIPVKVECDEEFCFQRHVALIKPLIDVDFLQNVLRSPLVKSQCDAWATGTAQKTVGLNSLKSILVPLPPLAEQKRIVAKLEELLPLCERLK